MPNKNSVTHSTANTSAHLKDKPGADALTKPEINSTSDAQFECHIEVADENAKVLTLLSANCQLSVAVIKQAIAKGALWLTRGKRTQRLRRVKKPLKQGDSLHFYFNQQVLNQTTAPAQLVADYKDYSIWFKPYGMLSQGSKWSDHLTISRFAQQYFIEQNSNDERATFIVHRLDRAATGLIIIAHSKKAARALSAMFEVHNLEKRYQIIVHGKLTNSPTPVNIDIDEKSATSHFSMLEYDQENDISKLEVLIETGRKHQIRKHAASLGLPVVGDRLHGDKSKVYNEALNLQLCAQSLKFECPLTSAKRSVQLPEKLSPTLITVKNLLTAS